MKIFNIFKNTKKKIENRKAEDRELINEGINALFVFLDEVLPEYKDEDFHTVTPQIFLVLYIIGMAKAWCNLSGLNEKNQNMISFVVIDGIYYKYNIELRDWTSFITSFFDPEESKKIYKYNFINEQIEQGKNHFFYFCTLKHIPHNPLNILLKNWCEIPFYNEDEPYEKGAIEGIFSKEEYSFISHKMMYELLEVDDGYESVYQQVLQYLEKYPFKRDRYYLS